MNTIPIVQDSIFEFSLDCDLVQSYLELVKESKNIVYKPAGLVGKMDAANTCVSYGYPVPEFLKLFDSIQSCIDEVSENKFGEKNQKISDAWIIKSNFGQKTDNHYHSHSIFSGVLYLQDHDTVTEFFPEDVFYSRYQQGMIFTEVKNNSEKIIVEPKFGKLIIFPSYLRHGVQTNKSKSKRYTLVFNTFFTGKVSNTSTQMLELNLLRTTEKNLNGRS